MQNLLSTLGLDSVDADPNSMPDGKYDGVVSKSSYVLSTAKATVAHVITYKVTDGAHKGKTNQQWFTLGGDVKDADGNFPESVDKVASYTPTMNEQAKQWYKKAFVDLGVPEAAISTTDVESLTGTPVTFGIKKNGSYVNINFVERRNASAASTESASSLSSEDIATLLY